MSTTTKSLTMCALLTLCACARAPGAPQANGGVSLAPDEQAAMGEIAYARVAREQACGPRMAVASDGASGLDARLTFLRNATVAEINPSWCKSNIHPRELEECVAKIKQVPCSVELKNVTTIASCNVKPLCGVPLEGTL
ncbi:MAG: hypothetical protein JWP87_4715 [Labilithrix sp.]|nr:hypothetical protein [Labilithrix sp.]